MIKGFFWVWDFRLRDFFGYENLACIFLGSLIWLRIFWGYLKESVELWLRSSANKVQTNVFCWCYSITPFWNLGIFWRLNFGPEIFLGFAGSPRDFFGSWLLAPFDHPCLKSQVLPLGMKQGQITVKSDGFDIPIHIVTTRNLLYCKNIWIILILDLKI